MVRSSQVGRLLGRAVKEIDPSGGTSTRGDGLPLLDSVHKARAEQRAVAADKMCRNNSIVRVQFPEGTESSTSSGWWKRRWKGGLALEILLRDAVEDGVAPCLPLFPAAARGSNVSGLGDVNCWSSSLWEAAVADEAGRNEMRRWRWYKRSGVGSAVRGGGRSSRSTVVRWVGRR